MSYLTPQWTPDYKQSKRYVRDKHLTKGKKNIITQDKKKSKSLERITSEGFLSYLNFVLVVVILLQILFLL